MFRSSDHPQRAHNVPLKLYVKSYFIILVSFGDAAAYNVYAYMLYPLQGDRSTI